MKTVLALLFSLLVLIPSLSWAAYISPAELVEVVEQRDGSIALKFKFTGNAGEKPQEKLHQLSQSSNAQTVGEWAGDTLAELNAITIAKNLSALQPGRTIAARTRTNPAPTPKQVWKEEAAEYELYKSLGITSAAFISDLNAKKSRLESTYQAGFID